MGRPPNDTLGRASQLFHALAQRLGRRDQVVVSVGPLRPGRRRVERLDRALDVRQQTVDLAMPVAQQSQAGSERRRDPLSLRCGVRFIRVHRGGQRRLNVVDCHVGQC
jgi:hypothetical protein